MQLQYGSNMTVQEQKSTHAGLSNQHGEQYKFLRKGRLLALHGIGNISASVHVRLRHYPAAYLLTDAAL